jgi:hypothetical protein
MEEGFRQWILNKARNTTALEMCDDIDFSCRLLSDVSRGRSGHFNKTSGKNPKSIDMMGMLYNEYKVSINTSGSV